MIERVPTKWEVVVLALADLGAGSRVVDTEDVAVRAFELAPTSFAWRKHPDQIDLDSVRVSLTDACKAKYGALSSGSVRTGWNLTQAGVAWASARGEDVRRALGVAVPSTRPEARLSTLHAGREAARLRSSQAFKHWSTGSSPSPRAVAAAFRIDAYTSDRDRSLKLNRMLEVAAERGDTDLQRFVNEMARVVLAAARPQLDGLGEGDRT